MKSHVCRALAGILILLSLGPAALAADRARNLPPQYRHWLNEEVNYIIGSNEKKAFLSLKTDSQRDTFIDNFWAIRNPDPNSQVNSYKEEHYRRLAYANEHFGGIARHDGWRTDMGRMYIVLGAPKQIMSYPAARNVRPMEIWFYQSPSPALPPYFYVLFYKRSTGEAYTLYSPYQDGPARLVSTLEAMNDQKRSLETLRKSLGDQVATISLSLIPGEHVNLDDYSPTLSSDVLLNTIAGLPDNPLTLDRLNINRAQEHVTMSAMVGERNMAMSYEVFRDNQGRAILSYLLSSSAPNPQLIGQRPDKSYYYDLTLRTSVLTPGGKSVYEQDDRLTANLTGLQADVARRKKFAAEARLPLSPGKYTLVATLTNNINTVASRQQISVTVPAASGDTIGISNLLAYRAPAAIPDPRGDLPFTASGLRFTPRGAQTVYLQEGQRLPLVFQLWLGPGTGAPDSADKIELRYTFGHATGTAGGPTVESEVIDASNRDGAGNLLTGHTLDTSSLTPGTYMLVVGANHLNTRQTAYASMTLVVEALPDFVDTWTAYGPADPEGVAVDDLKRGLSAEAQGADDDAQHWYARALTESSVDLRSLDRLAVLLQRRGQTQELAAMSRQPILAQAPAAPRTLLAIAQALQSTGDQKAEVQMLEAQIKLQPPNAGLYRALADACEATGDKTRAREMRSLAAGVDARSQ
ncbi:MAG TPA: GWxTD domain-containing protein [Terracidiphilus sp.]|nr:GWxTD domain-containing protein [Terracidiphilus sp.]